MSLNPIEKSLARGLYSRNPNLRANIETAFERVAGQSFSDEQIRSVLGDVLNGKSTTMGDLLKFSDFDPSSGNFSPEQAGILDTYVRELPGSPLNDAVKRGWQNRFNERDGVR